LGHRLAVPVAVPAAAHLADADVFLVHGRHRPDEARVADVRPGVSAGVGLVNDHHRVLLQADAFHVIQDPAVVHPPVLRRLSEDREARAVEQLREEVGQARLLPVGANGGGDGVHLFEVSRVAVGLDAALGRLDFAEEPPPGAE
jgi:hypothetical protein